MAALIVRKVTRSNSSKRNSVVGTASGELIAVGLADGKLRWRYKAGEAIGESSPTVANCHVYVGDLIGVVHAVNIADGKPAWTFKTQSEIKSSPVVVGDVLLMGSCLTFFLIYLHLTLYSSTSVPQVIVPTGPEALEYDVAFCKYEECVCGSASSF